VDDDRLLDAAMKLADRLAQGPTRALVATRQLLEESEHASYSARFRREIEFRPKFARARMRWRGARRSCGLVDDRMVMGVR